MSVKWLLDASCSLDEQMVGNLTAVVEGCLRKLGHGELVGPHAKAVFEFFIALGVTSADCSNILCELVKHAIDLGIAQRVGQRLNEFGVGQSSRMCPYPLESHGLRPL